MFTDQQIADWRDNQLHDYLKSLEDEDEDDKLVKCANCYEEVEETEVRLFKMHDINDGEELNYCISCIEIYKNENL